MGATGETIEGERRRAERAPLARRRSGSRSARHWAVLAGAVCAVAGMALFGLALTPDARGVGTHEQLGMRPCMAVALTGVPCPGCGVTTAVTLAARGELAASFLTQPFGFAIAVAAVGFLGWAVALHLRGRDLWIAVSTLPWRRLAGPTVALILAAWAWKVWRMTSG